MANSTDEDRRVNALVRNVTADLERKREEMDKILAAKEQRAPMTPLEWDERMKALERQAERLRREG